MPTLSARLLAIGCAFGLATSIGFGQGPAAPVITDGQSTAILTQAPECEECLEPAPLEPSPYAGSLCERSTLTGDWWGHRSHQQDCGLKWNIYSTQFGQGVASGGLERDFLYSGRVNYLLKVDGHKLGLWEGLSVNLHGETNYGESPNELTGALLPVNTGMLFPHTPPVTALTGVKVTQILSEQFVVSGGKLNTLDGFNQPYTGGARGVNGFMNISMLVPIVALRTVPYSTFGGEFLMLKDGEPIVTVLVLDPNDTPTVSGFDTFFDRGASVVGIVNLPTNFLDRPGHQGIGFTYSNSKYTALDDLRYFVLDRIRGEFPPLPQETGSWSLIYLFDQAVWVDPCDPKRSWGVFGNLGLSDGNPCPIRWAANIGLGGASPFHGRNLDSFGVGCYYDGVSESLKDLAPVAIPLRDEHGFEAFYNVGMTPWCHLTADLQVVTPARDQVAASIVYGLRLKVDF